VDNGLQANDRVPPLPFQPCDSNVVQNSEPYQHLSKEQLIELLKKSELKCTHLENENHALKKTQEAKQNEWDSVLQYSKTKEKEYESLQKSYKNVASVNEKLHKKLEYAWQQGVEHGKKEVLRVFEQIFSDAQIQSVMSNKRVLWTSEDIAGAIAFHACDRKAYVYARTVMKIPLPAESTIRRWAAKIQVRPGLQEDVLRVLGKLSSTLSDAERLVCITFDEVQLSPRTQYEKGRDAVVGPNNQAQVVLMRPLFGTWKQPFYFQFDEAMHKERFVEIVRQLYDVGFTVVASVCDLSFSNQTFLKSMGVFNTNASSCPHPSDNTKKNFFFADAPHMLKLFRNHLIDGSGYLINGRRVGIDIMKTTIKLIKG